MSELREQLDLLDMEDFLSTEGIDYRITQGSSGVQINIKECPRCGGRKWKVYMNADTGLGNCFHGDCVGQPGYNKFSFIRALNNDDNKETCKVIERYARERGWRPKPVRKPISRIAMESIMMPESEPVQNHPQAYEYLLRRGFDDKTIDYFGWTYCESGSFKYVGPDGKMRHQDYSGRILIPILNDQGGFGSFQGRDITGTAERRYLFPPGLTASGHLFYNAFNVGGCGAIVIAEGVFDAASIYVALAQDPLLNNVGVVASFGKHISSGDQEGRDQFGILMRLKSRGLHTVTLMWDGEMRAKCDALKAAAKIAGIGLWVRIAELPLDKDPNEVEPVVIRDAYRKATKYSLLNANRLRMQWHIEGSR